jgi:transcriptional regulator with XRE-family HTH domain
LLTSAQCRMARVALKLSTVQLADMAVVSTNTIARLEAGEQLKPRTLDAIQRALEAQGIEFLGEHGVSLRQ